MISLEEINSNLEDDSADGKQGNQMSFVTISCSLVPLIGGIYFILRIRSDGTYSNCRIINQVAMMSFRFRDHFLAD